MNIVQLDKISYYRQNRKILDNINLNIQKDQNWVFLGGNGSGKTTLVNILYGYLWATSGTVCLFGKLFGEVPLSEIQKRIGILQSSHQGAMLQKRLSVKDVLATGILSTIGYYGSITDEDEKKIQNMIESNQWIKNKDQNYSTLSSGEKKKLLLLRALIRDPELLVLDEPCSSMDITAREDFFSFLKEYRNKLGFPTILITHRTDEIPSYFSHVLMLKEGKVLISGTLQDTMTDKNLSELYSIPIRIQKIGNRFYSHVI
ncbi:MAG: ATP-binding cassette domain-containing protein [Leptospiraceae bacterium]|nr:ATP-binding cassette domain-containing protein [Leptospiraceae bacterium]MCP5495260.1 ATP-binding cassette domain-containing protein [Leptospiraceae bacterium]